MVVGWREFNREGKKMRRVLTPDSAREIKGNQGKGKGESGGLVEEWANHESHEMDETWLGVLKTTDLTDLHEWLRGLDEGYFEPRKSRKTRNLERGIGEC